MRTAVRGRAVHRRLSLGAALVIAVLGLSGCPSAGSQPEPTAADVPSGTTDPRPTRAVTAAPPTGHEPVGTAVAVDLSPNGERTWSALGLVAHRTQAVLLIQGAPYRNVPRLVTVSADGRPAGSVAVPGVAAAWTAHLLPDSTALVTGRLADEEALGYAVVDVRSRTPRTVTAVPVDPATSHVLGRSAVSFDGRTVWLYSGALVDGRYGYRLSGHEVTTGRLIASRDLLPDLRGIHVPDQELDVVGLAASPDGGVVLTVNVFPPGNGSFWSPRLLVYDAALEPLSGPLPMAPDRARATARAMALGPDGTTFVVVRGSSVSTLVALAPGARRPEPRLQLPGVRFTDDLLVDAHGRAVLPGPSGLRSIDLATGETTDIDLPCAGDVTVRGLASSTAPGMWILGGCFQDGSLRPMLWRVH